MTVRAIFQRYLELGCVRLLKAELDRSDILSKRRTSRSGVESGGHSFSRGALYALLANPLYIGEIRHRKLRHPGQHQAMVERAAMGAHPAAAAGAPGAPQELPWKPGTESADGALG